VATVNIEWCGHAIGDGRLLPSWLEINHVATKFVIKRNGDLIPSSPEGRRRVHVHNRSRAPEVP